MAYQFLIYEKIDAVLRIRLNRPEVLNALNLGLKRELEAALDEAVADDAIRAIILTGAGRAFSAGYDINVSGRTTLPTVEEWRDKLRDHLDNLMKIWDCRKPVIAAVNGYAVGGGMELCMVTCPLQTGPVYK